MFFFFFFFKQKTAYEMRISDWSSDVCSSDLISAASEEQSGGIDQVNRAVSQMDEVTQQNAALVEEAAAAAGSLQEQAQRLAEAVAVFKINAGEVIEVPAQQLTGNYAAPLVSQS